MEKQLLIETGTHATDLIVHFDEKINFSEFDERLCSTFSGIDLYEIDEEEYYEGNAKKEKILSIHGRYFDIVYAINNGISLYDVFEMYDADTESIIPFLLDDDNDIKSEYYTYSYNIYYLDKIKVEKNTKEKDMQHSY